MSGKRHARVHLVLLAAWAVTIPVAFVFGWWESVSFVAFASIYANMATHWSAYAGAHSEQVVQEERDEPT